jgi:hypothetical protein
MPGQVIPGHTEVLVNTYPYSNYNDDQWCLVEAIAPGSAAVYPVKVAIPGRGRGQYKYSELLGVREAARS